MWAGRAVAVQDARCQPALHQHMGREQPGHARADDGDVSHATRPHGNDAPARARTPRTDRPPPRSRVADSGVRTPTACSSGRPCARPAAMAADSVQPVPCVLRVDRRRALKGVAPCAVTRRSVQIAPRHAHPSSARPPRPWRAAQHTVRPSGRGWWPGHNPAGRRLGQVRGQQRRAANRARSASMASGGSRRSPDFATITGSSTMGRRSRPDHRPPWRWPGPRPACQLDRPDVQIVQNGTHLPCDHRGAGGFDQSHGAGVLRRQRGHHAGAIAAKGRKGLRSA